MGKVKDKEHHKLRCLVQVGPGSMKTFKMQNNKLSSYSVLPKALKKFNPPKTIILKAKHMSPIIIPFVFFMT